MPFTQEFLSRAYSLSKGYGYLKELKFNCRMGENICKWSNWQRINLQNLQAANAAQYQENKQPNPKMGRIPK